MNVELKLAYERSAEFFCKLGNAARDAAFSILKDQNGWSNMTAAAVMRDYQNEATEFWWKASRARRAAGYLE